MVGTDNYLGVDYTTPLTVAGGVGRGSVRIESKKTYNKGLFLVDIKHMPGGICGTWPAFWLEFSMVFLLFLAKVNQVSGIWYLALRRRD